MEEPMQPRAYPSHETSRESRLLALTMTASLIGHLVLFAVFVFGPVRMPRQSRLPRVVNVSLVSLLPSAPPGRLPGPPAIRKSVPADTPKTHAGKSPEKQTAPVSPKETVSIAREKWKPKTSLKKKTFKPAKVVQSAIKRIEKTAEDSKPDPLASAIGRLRDQVAASEKEKKDAAAVDSGEKKPGAEGDSAAGGAGDGVLTSEILLYQQALSYHIRNNWVFSEELAGNRFDLEVRLMIKIAASGEIKDVWFEKKSGNRYLDESAYKAIMKSNPLPALPKGYQRYNVGLIFTPSGLQ